VNYGHAPVTGNTYQYQKGESLTGYLEVEQSFGEKALARFQTQTGWKRALAVMMRQSKSPPRGGHRPATRA
jgi:hypothetical protein